MSKKMWIALGALLLVIAILVGVYFATSPKAQEGSKTITVEVVHADGSRKEFTYHTDELYLDKVLVAEGLIPEENIQDGMFTIVDGEEASWEKDKAYWAFYVLEEYASKGICATPVENGVTYKFKYTLSADAAAAMMQTAKTLYSEVYVLDLADGKLDGLEDGETIKVEGWLLENGITDSNDRAFKYEVKTEGDTSSVVFFYKDGARYIMYTEEGWKTVDQSTYDSASVSPKTDN